MVINILVSCFAKTVGWYNLIQVKISKSLQSFGPKEYILFKVSCRVFSTSIPSIIVGRFVEQDFFDNVTYEGFGEDDEDEEDGEEALP